MQKIILAALCLVLIGSLALTPNIVRAQSPQDCGYMSTSAPPSPVAYATQFYWLNALKFVPNGDVDCSFNAHIQFEDNGIQIGTYDVSYGYSCTASSKFVMDCSGTSRTEGRLNILLFPALPGKHKVTVTTADTSTTFIITVSEPPHHRWMPFITH